MDQLLILLKPELLIKTAGLLGIFLVLFAESGLFFGFFLPGDSLLFTAGVLASQGLLDYPTLCVVAFMGAVLGVAVGYWFGAKVGEALFKKEDSLLFKKHHLVSAQKFYEKNGSKTIVFARFIPFVRTFVPIIAGTVKMRYRTFLLFNIIGGFLWTVGLISLGYFLGNIPFVVMTGENFMDVELNKVFTSTPGFVCFFPKMTPPDRVLEKAMTVIKIRE